MEGKFKLSKAAEWRVSRINEQKYGCISNFDISDPHFHSFSFFSVDANDVEGGLDPALLALEDDGIDGE